MFCGLPFVINITPGSYSRRLAFLVTNFTDLCAKLSKSIQLQWYFKLRNMGLFLLSFFNVWENQIRLITDGATIKRDKIAEVILYGWNCDMYHISANIYLFGTSHTNTQAKTAFLPNIVILFFYKLCYEY